MMIVLEVVDQIKASSRMTQGLDEMGLSEDFLDEEPPHNKSRSSYQILMCPAFVLGSIRCIPGAHWDIGFEHFIQ